MSELASLSEHLTDEEWLAEFELVGNAHGSFKALGKDHVSVLTDPGSDTLIVSFDTLQSARIGSSEGLPHALKIAHEAGWAHLSLIAKRQTWFRDGKVYAYFDDLVDEDFFENYDSVVFFGSGMCGYAAAAFSVAAPGATVFALAPQATLDTEIAPWDDRFTAMRRTNFTDRFGYAPDMVEASDAAYIVYDPTMELDAMHAALFRGPMVHKIRYRHSASRIGADLQTMGLLGPLFQKAVAGTLSETDVFRALRKRREYLPYLRNLLNRVHIEERHWLTALLCRSVLQTKNAPRFQHHLDQALEKLRKEGRTLPDPKASPAKATA